MENVLEKINESSLKFLEQLTTEETYKTIVLEATKLIDAVSGYVLLEVDGTLKTAYASSPLPPFSPRRRGFSYKAYKKRKTFILETRKIAKAHPEILRAGIKYIFFIPLSYRQKSIGVLALHIPRGALTNEEVRALKLFGAMASLAIRKTQLYDETKKALEVRDHFTVLAAHELRTPLTSINGYIQLLCSRLGKENTIEGRWVYALYDESQRLTNLVQELLEINRLKTGQFQLKLQETSLISIVKRATEIIHTKYKGRKIIFKNMLGNVSDTVVADSEKMSRVLANLLDNAAKFSSEESRIDIALKIDKKDFLLKIRDHGVGVAKEDLQRIFEGFYKGQENFKSGMAIGLLFAKHVIVEHNGSIRLVSEKDKGTVIAIRLPYPKRGAQPH